MTISAFVATLRRHLSGSVLGSFERGAWCRRQRRHLRIPGHPVVWVRSDALAWAEWGARRGYFEVCRVGAMAYLRPLGVPAA